MNKLTDKEISQTSEIEPSDMEKLKELLNKMFPQGISAEDASCAKTAEDVLKNIDPSQLQQPNFKGKIRKAIQENAGYKDCKQAVEEAIKNIDPSKLLQPSFKGKIRKAIQENAGDEYCKQAVEEAIKKVEQSKLQQDETPYQGSVDIEKIREATGKMTLPSSNIEGVIKILGLDTNEQAETPYQGSIDIEKIREGLQQAAKGGHCAQTASQVLKAMLRDYEQANKLMDSMTSSLTPQAPEKAHTDKEQSAEIGIMAMQKAKSMDR